MKTTSLMNAEKISLIAEDLINNHDCGQIYNNNIFERVKMESVLTYFKKLTYVNKTILIIMLLYLIKIAILCVLNYIWFIDYYCVDYCFCVSSLTNYLILYRCFFSFM